MELAWFRNFQDAENINFTIYALSDADIARKHTLMGLKTHFRHVSFQVYTELVRFRKFQRALNIVIMIFEFYDADIVGKDTIISMWNKDL